jgi:hypothetical protein
VRRFNGSTAEEYVYDMKLFFAGRTFRPAYKGEVPIHLKYDCSNEVQLNV